MILRQLSVISIILILLANIFIACKTDNKNKNVIDPTIFSKVANEKSGEWGYSTKG